MESSLAEALTAFRSLSEPRKFSDNPFTLASWLDDPAAESEVEAAWPGDTLPAELSEAWSVSRQARLFEDVEYGQWGMVLLSPEESAGRTARERSNRPECWRDDDIVIGEFLGDVDVVVFAPSESADRRILIALPLDERRYWPGVGADLADFLTRYRHESGDKYWE